MIKKFIKLVIGMMALSWFAKKIHHCSHNEKQKETMTSKLKHYMDK